MPLISVIMPAYNAERTIMESIHSVQRQTLADFELIVINDGSTDRTLDRITTVKDPRLQVHSYERGRSTMARNRGISHAKAEFIAMIDADDLWTPDKLKAQFDALQKHPDSGVAYSWTIFIDEDGNFLSPDSQVFCEGYVYPDILTGFFLSNGSNAMIRRSCLESVGEYNTQLETTYDWHYWAKAASMCRFVLVPRYQVLYRISSWSESAQIDQVKKNLLEVADLNFSSAPMELQNNKGECLANIYLYLAFLCMTRSPNKKRVRQSGRYLATSFRIMPRKIKSRRFQNHLFAWLVLMLTPTKLIPEASIYLLKLRGRFMKRRFPQLNTPLNANIR